MGIVGRIFRNQITNAGGARKRQAGFQDIFWGPQRFRDLHSWKQLIQVVNEFDGDLKCVKPDIALECEMWRGKKKKLHEGKSKQAPKPCTSKEEMGRLMNQDRNTLKFTTEANQDRDS